MNNFCHLRVHTEYSVSSSVLRIKPLMQTLQERGDGAVAVCDSGNLFGSFKFSSQALRCGVKPVLGADVSVATGVGEDCATLSLLICSHEGYQNLCRMISEAGEERALGRRRRDDESPVSFDLLKKYSGGLIALSAGMDGYVGRCIQDGKEDLASQRVAELLDCFGDRFYLSIERVWNHSAEKRHIEFCVLEGERRSIPVVATNNVQFLRRDQHMAHTIRVGIHKSLNVNNENLQNLYSAEQYLKSAQEMTQLFDDLPEAIANTTEVVRRCNFFLTAARDSYLPRIDTPGGQSPEDHLIASARQKLESMLKGDVKLSAQKKVYRERLEFELGVIVKMGYAAYFLIVEEFVIWALANEVVVGPGRGSGPGSLVAYVLAITRVDPIRYDLLFERFLNPERVSLPDFDIDFDDQKRDHVIAHVAEKYGRDKVSQIITFGTMGARAVVRDVGRTLGKPYGQIDRIAKLIPFGIDMTLAIALESPEFAGEYKNPETREIIDRAREIEGLQRNPGRHAGGVVIAPDDLCCYCPMYYDDEGVAITQFDKDDLEAVGLVKYDFLGLRILSVMRDALQNIEKAGGERIDIDKIDLSDGKTLQLINRQRTLGVFQLESAGMRELISKLRPDCFDDITALVALYRPGPMEARVHDDYCERKHGEKETTYYHQCLKPVLESTYGVFIYQEQVMEAVRVMAGYSLGDADLLRRAIGKKKPEELERQKPIFVEGCIKNDISRKVAIEVFGLLNHFAGYGFNKSHSVSYGLLSFQTAWLKSHHPAAYMAALMSNEPDHDNIARMVRDCQEEGIKIQRPDLNESSEDFRVIDEHTILYGLGRIKGVGTSARHGDSFVEQLCKEREKNGPFKGFTDFLVRVPLEKCNSRSLIALVGSGACDVFAGDGDYLQLRLVLADAVERNIVDFAQARKAALESGQGGLFAAGDSDSSNDVDEFEYHDVPADERKALAYEYEALNFYLGVHPLELLRHSSPTLANLPKLADLADKRGTNFCLFEVRDIATARRGGHLTVSCDDEQNNQILFFAHERADKSASPPWSCKGRIALARVEVGASRVNIHNLYREDDIREHFCRCQEFDLNINEAEAEAVCNQLQTALNEAKPGHTKLQFNYTQNGMKGKFELDQGIRLDTHLYNALAELPACTPTKTQYELKK